MRCSKIRQDCKRRGLHAAKAPGLPKGRRAQPQRDGAGAIEPQVVVLVLAAEGLQVGGVVPLARVGLLGHRGEGSADRDLVESPELETVHATSVAEMLKHLPGDHRALAARIGGDDDPLHALKRLLDRVDLGLVRLAGAAGAVGDRNALEHDREGVEAPRLPLVPHAAGLLGRQEVPLGRNTDRARRLEEALQLAHGRGLLEEEQRARC